MVEESSALPSFSSNFGKLGSVVGCPVSVSAYIIAVRGQQYKGEDHTVPWEDLAKVMLPKIIRRFGRQGFEKIEAEATNIALTWRRPSESAAKEIRVAEGNFLQECSICHETRYLHAAVPCGHIACRDCLIRAKEGNGKCSFCNGVIGDTQVLFKP